MGYFINKSCTNDCMSLNITISEDKYIFLLQKINLKKICVKLFTFFKILSFLDIFSLD